MVKSRIAREIDEILSHSAGRATSKIISHDEQDNTYVVESTKMAYVAAEEVGLKNPRLITEYSVGNGVKHWIFTAEK